MSKGGGNGTDPGGRFPPESAAPLAHLGPDIPWRGCVPAEPASVSPDNRTVAPTAARGSRRDTNEPRSKSEFDHGSWRLHGHLSPSLRARKERSPKFRGAGSTAWEQISYRANSTLVFGQDVSGKRLESSRRSTAQPHPHGYTKTTSVPDSTRWYTPFLRYNRKSDR